MPRASLIVLGCSLILWACITQANHHLAPAHVTLFAGGLLVTFSALRLEFREGWWPVLLTGLMVDGQTPVHFGVHGLLFVAAYAVIYQLRNRFPREETVFAIFAALLANLALFLILTIGLLRRSPDPWSMSGRLLTDFLASESLIVIAGPWFFALQERSLELAGISLRREQRGIL